MNRTKLLLFFNWPDTRIQIPMCMHVLASISTIFSWRKSQMCSCFQRLGAWSVMCHRWPSENDMHPSEILQLNSQCCLLGRFAKMLYFIVHDLDQSSCCACHMSIAYIHVKLRSRVSQLNQHIFPIFIFELPPSQNNVQFFFDLAHDDDTWTHVYHRLRRNHTCWCFAQLFEDLGCWLNSR